MNDFPVILSDVGTLNAGSVFTPDADKMQNVYRQPIQIEEMRVLLSLLGPVGEASTGGVFSLGALTRVKIDAGRKSLTNGFVPIGLFGPREQASISPWATQISAGAMSGIYDYYKWRLPVPMPLDIGTPFLPTFKWITPAGVIASTQGGNNNSLRVNVALVGRMIKDGVMPKSARVPYVSAFIPVPGQVQSDDTDLRNPFPDKPLLVQRMCAKIFVPTALNGLVPQNAEAWIDTDSTWQILAYAINNGVGGPVQNIDKAGVADTYRASIMRRFKLEDQDGGWIVRNHTSWMAAFDGPRMSWTFNREIGPDSSWLLSLENPASGIYIPTVSVVGSREEQFLW